METPAEKTLNQVLDGSGKLAQLMRAQRQFDALDRAVKPALAEWCRNHLRVACVEGETLVLAVQSSAWAARARLEADTALAAARRLWPGALTRARVIVAPWRDTPGQ